MAFSSATVSKKSVSKLLGHIVYSLSFADLFLPLFALLVKNNKNYNN